MDLTPKYISKYIKMCEKSEEIQRNWEPRIGDMVAFGNRSVGIICCREDKERFETYRIVSISPHIYGNFYWQDRSQCIWLPYQSQLQGMLRPHNYFWYYMGLETLNREMSNIYGNWYVNEGFDSGEKFWLAFVMYKKYNKIWDNEKERWVEK